MVNSEDIDTKLLEKFEQEIWSKVPHIEEGGVKTIVNPTPQYADKKNLEQLCKRCL